MVEFTHAQRRDILMLRGLNRTYGEIAAHLTSQYDLDVSKSSVGRVVREFEDRAYDEGPRPVFDGAVMYGVLDDVL